MNPDVEHPQERPAAGGGRIPGLKGWHLGIVVGSVILGCFGVMAVLAGVLAPQDPYRIPEELQAYSLLPPRAGHWFGTDLLGRDLLSRVLYGSRISLLVGILVEMAVTPVGVTIGLFAGYFGGRMDTVLMRLTDAVMAFPGLVLAIALTAVLEKPGLMSVIVVLAAVRWTTVARLVRGQVLSLREAEHIAAVTALGAGRGRIIFRHLLPNCLAPILVAMTFGVASNILSEAGLGFLGLGIQPPMVSWGSLLAEGAAYLTVTPWLCLFPGVAITCTVLGFHLLGDGLRDVCDPRLRS
jgi:ABC-type dipeptide/oligopeptide/nickel transport system permease subunit